MPQPIITSLPHRFRFAPSLLVAIVTIFVLFFLYSLDAFAAKGECATFNGHTECADFTVFDPFMKTAKLKSESMALNIVSLMKNTFLLLAIIELCWSAAIWALEKDNMSALGSELIQKVMFIGFFLALLESAHIWLPMIEHSFEEAGAKVGAFSGPPSVDSIIVNGLNLILIIWKDSPLFQDGPDWVHGNILVNICFVVVDLIKAVTALLRIAIKALIPSIGGLIDLLIEAPCRILNIVLHLPQLILAFIVSVVIIVVYAIAAFQYFALLMESYVVLVAGMVFLGLGSSRWTNQYATKTLSHAVTIGVRMLVLLIALAFMQTIIDTEIKNGFYFDTEPLLRMLALAIFMMFVVMQAPDMAMVLVDGQGQQVSSSMTLSSVARNMSTIASTVSGGVGKVANMVSQVSKAAGKLNSKGSGSATLGKGGGGASGAVKGLGK